MARFLYMAQVGRQKYIMMFILAFQISRRMVPSNFQGCGEMKATSFPHGLLLIFQRCVTKVRRF